MDESPHIWHGAVVLCATGSWEDEIKPPERQLAEFLSVHAPVLYVDPPTTTLAGLNPSGDPSQAASSGAKPRLRRVGRRITRLSLGTYEDLGWAVCKLGATVRAVVATSTMRPPAGVCGDECRVMWARGGDPGDAGSYLAPQGAGADLVVTSCPEVVARPGGNGPEPLLIPFGCDAGAFAGSETSPWPDDVTVGPPVAGYVGRLDDSIDTELLEAVLDEGMSLLLVGPGEEAGGVAPRISSLLDRPGVQWVGPKPFRELPSYLQAIDVGLVPYRAGSAHLESFSSKALEYLSAGLPVVVPDLPGMRALGTGLVVTAHTGGTFAGEARRATERRRDPEALRARQAFAALRDWAGRARDWAGLLGLPVAGGTSRTAAVSCGGGGVSARG